MLIIVDNKIPEQAKDKLSKYGDIFNLKTQDIVYPAISGHPDIFVFQYDNKLIIAPQSPQNLIDKLHYANIDFQFGEKDLGSKYPFTTPYNVSYGKGIFIGNRKNADSTIITLSQGKSWIESPQAYARCNSIILDSEHIITSEISINKAIPSSLYINPKEIILQGFEYGFFGGCVGIYNQNLFILGSLKYHSHGNEIMEYCKKVSYEIVELYDGPLFDGGGIMFCQ